MRRATWKLAQSEHPRDHKTSLTGLRGTLFTMKSDTSLHHTVRTHVHKFQPHPIVLAEAQVTCHEGATIEKSNVSATPWIGDDVDPFSIAIVTRARGRVEAHAHLAACMEAKSKALSSSRVSDGQPRH